MGINIQNFIIKTVETTTSKYNEKLERHVDYKKPLVKTTTVYQQENVYDSFDLYEHLNYWKSLRNDINLVTFGMNKSADFYPIEIKYNLNGTKFRIQSKKYNKDVTIETPLSGEHNVKNILASYAVSNILNNPDEIFITKLKNNLNSVIRQKQSKWIKGSVLIDDTYNANPESVKNALDLLATSRKRKIFVFGDMLELEDIEIRCIRRSECMRLQKKLIFFLDLEI